MARKKKDSADNSKIQKIEAPETGNRVARPAARNAGHAATASKTDERILFQFKITLIGTDPEIWRRIQVEDCTLNTLHMYIQHVMGWENYHLHEFEIDRKRYGDPGMLDGGFDDDASDSTIVMLSDIIPKNKRRLRFNYMYDFGDSWNHEICFEGFQKPEPGKKYPLCLEGERACPPEDIGGIYGYYSLLEELAESNEDSDWSDFDPEKFDAKAATKGMVRCISASRR